MPDETTKSEKGCQGAGDVERLDIDSCSAQTCGNVTEATSGADCSNSDLSSDSSNNNELDADDLAQRLKNAERELEELNNRYLLALADCDNIKKRARAERDALRSTVICEFVGSLLPVIDNLDRAIQSGESGDSQAMVDGLKMIRSQIDAVLEAEGVRCIDAVGAQFDPNKHDAVMAVELDGYADNEIVEEFQRGYEASGRVIRPSMVKVNRLRD